MPVHKAGSGRPSWRSGPGRPTAQLRSSEVDHVAIADMARLKKPGNLASDGTSTRSSSTGTNTSSSASAYDTVEQISTIFDGTNVSLRRNNRVAA